MAVGPPSFENVITGTHTHTHTLTNTQPCQPKLRHTPHQARFRPLLHLLPGQFKKEAVPAGGVTICEQTSIEVFRTVMFI